MTEAEAREIVERYEALAKTIVRSTDQEIGPGKFHVEFPVQIGSRTASVRENAQWADEWNLHSACMDLD